MVTVILKTGGSPGSNIDQYANVSAIGAQNTNTGTKATDLTNATTGLNAGAFAQITYVDPNNATQVRIIPASDIKTVL